MRRRGHKPGRHQRGVAVITALLLTTLAVTIVASLFWQQQVQVRSMENQRLHLQTKWILRGALDWARLILRQDGFDSQVTTLDGVWATPLAETRLDDYVERERVEGEKFDATLSGQISDAQSRYNLTNLATGRVVNPAEVAVFGRLLNNLQLDPALAQATATAMSKTQLLSASTTSTESGTAAGAGSGSSTDSSATDSTAGTDSADSGSTTAGAASGSTSGDSQQQLEFMRVEDLLSVAGFTPESVQRLSLYVTVLPEATALNVNTAAAQVLAAVANVSVSEAASLVASRKSSYFKDKADLTVRLNGKNMPADVKWDVKSSYFLVLSHVRLDRAALDAEALMVRQAGNRMLTRLVSIREY